MLPVPVDQLPQVRLGCLEVLLYLDLLYFFELAFN